MGGGGGERERESMTKSNAQWILVTIATLLNHSSSPLLLCKDNQTVTSHTTTLGLSVQIQPGKDMKCTLHCPKHPI